MSNIMSLVYFNMLLLIFVCVLFLFHYSLIFICFKFCISLSDISTIYICSVVINIFVSFKRKK